MALLANQGWRILQNEDTCLYRIFKAKYFFKVSFFESKLGANPSYAWRGILEAKRRLLEGCRWRVWTRKTIKIWSDVWIPGHKTLVLELDRMQGNHMEATVDTLIDQETKWWKVEYIRALFNPIVAADILKVMLSSNHYDGK